MRRERALARLRNLLLASALVILGQILIAPGVLAASSLALNPNQGPVAQAFMATYVLPGRCSTGFVSFSWDGLGPRAGTLLGTQPCVNGAASVSATLKSPGTAPAGDHHVYGYFSTSDGLDAGVANATALYTIAPLPTVTTLAATGVTPYSATLTGTVNPHGCTLTPGGVTWSFLLGTTPSHGLKGPVGAISPTSTTDVAIGGTVNGLTPSTLYHYQLTAFGPCDGGEGTDRTFTTPAATIANLSVTTGGASNITDHTVTLSGTVNPHGCPAAGGGGTWSVIVGTTTNYGLQGPGGVFTPNSDVDTVVSGSMTGLTPSTLYHYQMTGYGPCGGGVGADATFTTAAVITPDATVTTLAASGVTDHTATLNGSVNPHGCTAGGAGGGTWSFVVGKTKAYGLPGPLGVFDPKSAMDIPVSGVMSGLEASTTYHFQLTAYTACGAGNAEDMTFTTTIETVLPLKVVTVSATDISDHGATVGGTIAPQGCKVTTGGGTWSVIYGSTAGYGKAGPNGFFDAKSTGVMTRKGSIAGLSPGTTYHFSLTAADGCGAGQGEDVSFTTSSPPLGGALLPVVVVGGLLGLGGLGFAAFKLGWLKF